MTKQDEIIEMARQAGMYGLVEGGLIEEFEAFAELVEDKQRNRLANELQKMTLNDTANSIAIWIREQK